ncbi:MAG TPA: endonuclease/exonuclease/phosphatase family protein, partial [Bacteroidales bacterium]|nr:endonuclease/exonuclease/phosphatase family protein [Bacteroidales bacterium]
MTFNIRYDNPGDGEYAWPQRKPMVLDVIANNKPDIIGMQEVLKSQLDTLMNALPDYDSYGVGR